MRGSSSSWLCFFCPQHAVSSACTGPGGGHGRLREAAASRRAHGTEGDTPRSAGGLRAGGGPGPRPDCRLSGLYQSHTALGMELEPV